MIATNFAGDMAHWAHTAPILAAPLNDADLDRLQAALDSLLDQVGSDEDHLLMPLVDIIGGHIAAYEHDHYPMPDAVDAIGMLRHLMEVHGLRQSDLPEIGSQGVVSDVFSGRREMNLRQVKALAKRFGLPVANFID